MFNCMPMKEDASDGNSTSHSCRSPTEVVVGAKSSWRPGFVSGCLGLGCLPTETCGCRCPECETDSGTQCLTGSIVEHRRQMDSAPVMMRLSIRPLTYIGPGNGFPTRPKS